jgi:metal-responsive CopG/Arc/MetJ family transcriptional regulator
VGGEMTRIQFYLEPELKKQLEFLASQHKISKAELIRQSIRKFLKEEKVNEEEPLLEIIGLGRSGIDNVSEKHDKYLAEEKLKRKTE